MLILPPTNHCACGGSHFSTPSHFLNQWSSLSANRAQNSSGLALASTRNASSSAIDLMCAFSANAAGGLKTRSSCCSDSMLVVAEDISVSPVSFVLIKLVFACLSHKHRKDKPEEPRRRGTSPTV